MKLKDAMPARVRENLGASPTWHRNCLEATKIVETKTGKVLSGGVARPGKTARDRAKKRSGIRGNPGTPDGVGGNDEG